MDFSTKCVRAFYGGNAPCSVPDVNLSVACDLSNNSGFFDDNDLTYRRYRHKNAASLEAALKDLYGLPQESKACVTSSGAAAFLLVCQHFRNRRRFATTGGIEHDCLEIIKRFANAHEETDKFREGDIVFCTPLGNPFLEKYDIADICRRAHKARATVVVDNAMLSIANYNPFDDGADIVIDSITKYTSGRGDTLLGAVLGLGSAQTNAVRALGLIAHPIDCYLAQSALPTLPLRTARIQQTAARVAAYVRTIGNNVCYDDRIGIITFSLGDFDRHKTICKSTRIFFYGATFGQNNSTIFAGRLCDRDYIRISVGLESADDLIADLKQAIKGA